MTRGRHPIRCSLKVKEWVAEIENDIRLFYLLFEPASSPDEMLRREVKSKAGSPKCPSDLSQMMVCVRISLAGHQCRRYPMEECIA